MKKILLSLAAVLFAFGANAQTEVVFDFSSASAYGYEDPANGEFAQVNNGDVISKDGVSLTVTYESGNGFRFFANTNTGVINFRGYVGSTLTIAAPADSKVTSIKIEGSNLGSTYMTGEGYANGMWEGSEEAVVLNVIKSPVQMNKMTVVLDGDAPGEFTPAGTGDGTVESPYDVTRAIDIINNGKYTNDEVYIKGVVTRTQDNWVETYTDLTYWISVDGTQVAELQAYRGKYLGKQDFTADNLLEDGDEVVVVGKLTSYNGTPEINSGSYLYSLNGQTYTPPTYDIVGDGSQENPYTVDDIINLGIETSDGNKYWVKGYICGNVNTSNGNSLLAEGSDPVASNIGLGATADATKVIPVQLPVGEVREALNIADHPENVGKEVMIYGTLEKYCGKAGVKNVAEAIIDGPSTGINTVGTAASAERYNLAGQKVGASFRGIVIENGKKVIR